MQEIQLSISAAEFKRLNNLYPNTGKSSNVGKRAEELVKYHFRALYPSCEFTEQNDGSDLLIKWPDGEEKIEIKGTADKSIAYNKLKVSSEDSYKLLSNGLPMYRVVSVYDRKPKIFVLKYSEDFVMESEARWKVKKA